MMDRIPRTTRHRWRQTHKGVTDAEFDWLAARCIETETPMKPSITRGFGLAVGSREERWKAARFEAIRDDCPQTFRRRNGGYMSVLRSQVREGFTVNLFVTEVVTPPVLLPITIKEVELGGAVVEEIERTILWRAIVRQERRILIDGALPLESKLSQSSPLQASQCGLLPMTPP